MHGFSAGNCRARQAARALVGATALAVGGCGWIDVGWGALTYPTTKAGESANVVVSGGFAYATQGDHGIAVIDLASPASRRVIPAAPGTSVDDLAVADGLLFALDAHPPGHLGTYSLADPATPTLVQAPAPVAVGPFSGVSAANGLVVVSGGTSLLSLRRYTREGNLGAEVTTLDLGRGQPDVLLADDHRHAFVSVHDEGPHFSLAILELTSEPLAARPIAKLPLDTYGFTPGGARPASFPIEMATIANLLLVASAAGLQVIDVANPAAPRILATFKPTALPVNVDARAGVAAVVGSDPAPELSLVDLANPVSPKLLRSIRLPEGSLATGVAIAGRQVVVAAHAADTLVFNLDEFTR